MASSSENDNGSTSGGGFGQLLKEDLTRLESGLSQHRVDLMGVVGAACGAGATSRRIRPAWLGRRPSKKTGALWGSSARGTTLEPTPKWTKRCSGA